MAKVLKRVWLGNQGPYLYDPERSYRDGVNMCSLRADGDVLVEGGITISGDLRVRGRMRQESSQGVNTNSPTAQDYQLFMAVHKQAGVF